MPPETGELRRRLMSMPPETEELRRRLMLMPPETGELRQRLMSMPPKTGEEEMVAAESQLSSLPLRHRLLLRLMVCEAAVTVACMPV